MDLNPSVPYQLTHLFEVVASADITADRIAKEFDLLLSLAIITPGIATAAASVGGSVSVAVPITGGFGDNVGDAVQQIAGRAWWSKRGTTRSDSRGGEKDHGSGQEKITYQGHRQLWHRYPPTS